MARVIAIYSDQGGTGKSHLTANLGSLLACGGRRVGLLDTAMQSPSLHHILGVELAADAPSLATYLSGRCEIEDAVYDISAQVDAGAGGGVLLLVPASVDHASAADLLTVGYDLGLLAEACSRLIERFELDVLFLDTHPGIGNEASVAVALADIAVLVVRPDAVTTGRNAPAAPVSTYQWPRRLLVVNMMPPAGDEASLRDRLRVVLDAEPIAVLPYSPELCGLNSERVFVCDFPNHGLVDQLRLLTEVLTTAEPALDGAIRDLAFGPVGRLAD
jgi:MinD-like ATPase involved in chromosome partitioning or flagellar assembly